MHGAGGIEVGVIWNECDDHAPAFSLADVVAERLRDGIERQRAVDEALHEGQSTHCAALFRAHCPIVLARHEASLTGIEAGGEQPLLMRSENDYSNQAA